MPSVQQDVMHKLYGGTDVWAEFSPTINVGDVQGWNGDHYSLECVVEMPDAAIVIDVGVWKGQSTITLANAMKRRGYDACVIAVDTFLGSPEHWHMPELYRREHGRPDIYATFMSNCWNADVADYVVPLAQTSITAAKILGHFGIQASVIHVDAAHEYEEVLRDAEEYWKLLRPGGYLIGDDYAEGWPGVIKGAQEFSVRYDVPISIEWPKWIAKKPS